MRSLFLSYQLIFLLILLNLSTLQASSNQCLELFKNETTNPGIHSSAIIDGFSDTPIVQRRNWFTRWVKSETNRVPMRSNVNLLDIAVAKEAFDRLMQSSVRHVQGTEIISEKEQHRFVEAATLGASVLLTSNGISHEIIRTTDLQFKKGVYIRIHTSKEGGDPLKSLVQLADQLSNYGTDLTVFFYAAYMGAQAAYVPSAKDSLTTFYKKLKAHFLDMLPLDRPLLALSQYSILHPDAALSMMDIRHEFDHARSYHDQKGNRKSPYYGMVQFAKDNILAFMKENPEIATVMSSGYSRLSLDENLTHTNHYESFAKEFVTPGTSIHEGGFPSLKLHLSTYGLIHVGLNRASQFIVKQMLREVRKSEATRVHFFQNNGSIFAELKVEGTYENTTIKATPLIKLPQATSKMNRVQLIDQLRIQVESLEAVLPAQLGLAIWATQLGHIEADVAYAGVPQNVLGQIFLNSFNAKIQSGHSTELVLQILQMTFIRDIGMWRLGMQ